MNNTSLKIMLIVLLSLLAISILGFMVVAIHGNLNFSLKSDESKIILEKNYETTNLGKIKIESISSEITVKQSQDETIKVVIYGEEKDYTESKIENNMLSILKKEKSNFCFGFCYSNLDEIIVYLPSNLENKVEIQSVSGDVTVADFEKINITAKTTSGDIKIGKVKESNLDTKSGDITLSLTTKSTIKTISGDIFVNDVKENIDIETISGDIKIENMICKKDSEIKTTSGDVTINQIRDAYIETHTTSGDIDIRENNRYAEYSLSIKTTSGDIKVK